MTISEIFSGVNLHTPHLLAASNLDRASIIVSYQDVAAIDRCSTSIRRGAAQND